MYTVGLDVDTLVSSNIVRYWNMIKLCSGKFHFNYLDPLSSFILLGKILNKEQPVENQLLNNIKEDEEIKLISDHLLKHKYPETDEDFGYYLAGLIEGNGNFEDNGLEIVFNEKDVQLAYYIKKRIGFGKINKIKDKKIYKYSLRHSRGLINILNLTNGKFIKKDKIEQLKTYSYDIQYNINILLPIKTNLFKTYWLAGFTDANGSFYITISKNEILEKNIRLEFKINQKNSINPDFFILKFGGGNLNYFKSKNIYCWNSTNFKIGYKVIKYFDHFHLNSSKYIQFFKWRKTYRIIQRKEHLTIKGLNKIYKLKKSLENLRK